jgi:GTPase SAR1 family protein
MSRLVILDGPKGAGKSTIAQRLVHHLNENNIPAIYHKHLRDPLNEFNNMFKLIVADSEVVTVVDRFVWTEWVMGIYLDRDPAKELTRKCIMLDKLIRYRNFPHILLLPTNDILKARIEAREEESRRKMDMSWDLVQPLWNAAYGQSNMAKIPNITEEDQTRIINYIMVMLGIKSNFMI